MNYNLQFIIPYIIKYKLKLLKIMTTFIHTIQNYIYMYYYNINTLTNINKCNTITYIYDLSFI